jgi:hypothetical protein
MCEKLNVIYSFGSFQNKLHELNVFKTMSKDLFKGNSKQYICYKLKLGYNNYEPYTTNYIFIIKYNWINGILKNFKEHLLSMMLTRHDNKNQM